MKDFDNIEDFAPEFDEALEMEESLFREVRITVDRGQSPDV